MKDRYHLKASYRAQSLILGTRVTSHCGVPTVIKHKIYSPSIQSLQMCPNGVLIVLEYKFFSCFLGISADCLKVGNIFNSKVAREERKVL
jgi:hypothetical protein